MVVEVYMYVTLSDTRGTRLVGAVVYQAINILVPRPSSPPVFDRLHAALQKRSKTGGVEGLRNEASNKQVASFSLLLCSRLASHVPSHPYSILAVRWEQ